MWNTKDFTSRTVTDRNNVDNSDQIKKEVRKALAELFEKYKDRGILSVYLYGSVTGPDFNPSKSDIDSIAVVNETVPVELENEMQNYLGQHFPEIQKFGIRILYLDELISLEKRGSRLTFFIPPKLLLLDFPYWEHVAGKEFSRSEFPSVSQEDGIREGYSVLKTWNWEQVDSVVTEKVGNYLKVLARILWAIDGSAGKKYKFSYSQLAERNDTYKQIADLILEIKKDGWMGDIFLAHKPVFQKFVEEVKE